MWVFLCWFRVFVSFKKFDMEIFGFAWNLSSFVDFILFFQKIYHFLWNAWTQLSNYVIKAKLKQLMGNLGFFFHWKSWVHKAIGFASNLYTQLSDYGEGANGQYVLHKVSWISDGFVVLSSADLEIPRGGFRRRLKKKSDRKRKKMVNRK